LSSETNKKECLAVVFLPGRELARYPDQFARFEFLQKHYSVSTVVASSSAKVEGSRRTYCIPHLNSLLFSLRAAWILQWKKRDYDFIYLIGLPAAGIFGLFRARCPVIAYAPTHLEQAFGPERQRPFKLMAWLKLATFLRGLGRLTSVMAISRQLAALYQGRTGRVSLIPMGVDLDLYRDCHPAPAADGHLNIVYPGSGGPGRGLDLVLECARRMVAEGVAATFHLVGCAEPMLERALAESPELAQALRLYPLMPYADVVRLYGQMQAGVSLLETNVFYTTSPPQKIFEYMAAGLPVLCNDIVTHTDYVGDSAIVVGWSAEALFDGVLALRDRYPALAAAAALKRGQMGDHARTAVERRFVEELEYDLRSIHNAGR